MKQIIFSLILFVFHQLSLANTATILNEENLPPQFKATYDIHKKGFRVGKMVVTLKKNGRELIYESTANPVGLASFFTDEDQITDRAVLELIDDSYRTIEFTHKVTGGKKNRNEHYLFNWNNNKVTITYKDRNSILDIPANTFDNFSTQLLLMRAPEYKNIQSTYSVISKGRLKNYIYKRESKEEIETKLGKLKSNKYIRIKDNDKKTTYLAWYSESLHYIPVRLEKVENGKLDLSIQITSITWL